MSAEWFHDGMRMILDLGRAGDIAEVAVNGRNLGIVWKAPWQIDVSDALKPGENRLEIKVTNEWTNRLIGDRALPPEKRVLSDPGPASGGREPPPQPLPESGLIGPVVLFSRPGQSL
jgi:hypothetical protein